MDVVGAVTNTVAVTGPVRLDRTTESRPDERTVESVPADETDGPRDTDRTARKEAPVVRLIRDSAENFSEVIGAATDADADGVISGSHVDVYA